MSKSDLLGSTLNWPGKGLYGIKSSVLQTTETNLVKQEIISDHMKNHYRRLHSARSAIDSKPPKAMILGQKCRDRARKEMAQMVYTQGILAQFATTNPESFRATPRGRSSHSARSQQRFVQSQPVTSRARSRSIDSARRLKRSLTMNGSMQNLHKNRGDDVNIAENLFDGGALSQALTTMAALGKMTSSERNRSSADVLDKHSDSFSQPKPTEYKPRLVKRDANSNLRNNRAYYNPPSKIKKQPVISAKEASNAVKTQKPDNDEQLALREQLNRSLELRNDVENNIKKAKVKTKPNAVLKKQSDATLRQFGLTEQERLQYVRFMQDVTNAILRKDLTTESAIEKLFEIHIDRNRGALDERRLRDLLEALKEDLGVVSSRKGTTYASLDRATNFDRDPLPPPVPLSNRDESLILTPKTPHNESRRSSYDVNSPLPWQLEVESANRPAIAPRIISSSKQDVPLERPLDSSSDDYLFTTPAKPKPRLSLQANSVDRQPLKSASLEEPDLTTELNFNTTIRKPMTTHHEIDWLKDTEPEKTNAVENPPSRALIKETIDEVGDDDDDEPRFSPREEQNGYAYDSFEDENNMED